MDWVDALILGLVQGLAEYLPISSSGHLEIFREILGIELPAADVLQFDVLLHAATVLSTIVVLWPMFRRLCADFFTFHRGPGFDYVLKLLLSCIPIGIVGVCFKDRVESFFGGSLTVVGICLMVTAMLLIFAHLSARRKSPADGRNISWWDAIVIGCAQSVAVLPGLSRSGTTIATGIMLGDKRNEVAQFSFLMVIIPILGEALLDTVKIIKTPDESSHIGMIPMIVGFVVAFVVGCGACKWMIDLVKRGKLVWFAAYCAVMAIICLLWQ